MSTDYRHDTDEILVVAIIGCPEGCQSVEATFEGEPKAAREAAETASEEFSNCSTCGTEMGVLRTEEPTEELT